MLSGFLATQGILRYGAVTPEMRRRAADALARMGVAHLAKRRLDEMSTGEARRVLLARALVTAPRALILDEPTTGFDLVARHDFTERVRQIAREGTTLILITHHIEEIVPEIQRIVLVGHGRIAAAGPKRDILTSASLSDAVQRADRARGRRWLLLRAPDAMTARNAKGLASPKPKATVGVIGLGIMGSAMAANLVRAGFRVIGYDVLPEAGSSFGVPAGCPSAIARRSAAGPPSSSPRCRHPMR